jgi:predicted DNA-binding WGR domain protein
LDEQSAHWQADAMIAQPYQLYVERKDVARNMARYYRLSIEPNLFGEICLVRQWGRIGAKGQSKIHRFETESDAVDLFLDLLQQKRKRGYLVPSTFIELLCH